MGINLSAQNLVLVVFLLPQHESKLAQAHFLGWVARGDRGISIRIDIVEIIRIEDFGGPGFPSKEQTPAPTFVLPPAGELGTHQVGRFDCIGAVLGAFFQVIVTIVKLAITVGLFILVRALVLVKILKAARVMIDVRVYTLAIARGRLRGLPRWLGRGLFCGGFRVPGRRRGRGSLGRRRGRGS